jgi:hypothetical protein
MCLTYLYRAVNGRISYHSEVEGLTYFKKHFILIVKIRINKDLYDRKRLFRKAGQ